MNSALRIFLLFTVFVFFRQSVAATHVVTDVSCEENAGQWIYEVLHDGCRNDKWQIEPTHDHQEAVLTDGCSTANRICNSRPQRLLPSYGPLPNKISGRISSNSYYKNKVKTYVGRYSLSASMPFLLIAPCDYYVIALRHIIR